MGINIFYALREILYSLVYVEYSHVSENIDGHFLLLILGFLPLQTLVSSLENKIGETEKRYEEANKISQERLKQALDAETKIIQLKTAMQRFRL